MLIYRVDVLKWVYIERKNWLKENDKYDEIDYIDDAKTESYTKYFSNFEEGSKFINNITKGFNQYWADVTPRTYGDEEVLEYHNGSEWDEEITITTNWVDVDDSFVNAIKEGLKIQ